MMRNFLRFLSFSAAAGLIALGLWRSATWSDEQWLVTLVVSGALLALSWWPVGGRSMPIFNRTLLRWSTIVAVVFVLITVQLVRLQIVESSSIATRVEVTNDGEVVQNPRIGVAESGVRRGSIFDRNGVTLAESVPDEAGGYERVYPEPAVSGVIGYYSPILYGASQLEAFYGPELSGERGGNPAAEWVDDILNRESTGYELGLTLDIELQRQASNLLDGRAGAVVVMNADSGEVLAMSSAPQFDPERLSIESASDSDEEVNEAVNYWSELVIAEDSPLVFRPTQGLYAPGSTFKMVTAGTALASGDDIDTDTVYRDEGILEVDGRVIVELNRPDETKVNWTLEESFAYSLNVVFAQIGLQLGGDDLAEGAAKFGIGDELPFGLDVNESQLANDIDNLNNRTLVADTAFGQGEILVTPLQMALVGAAIANDGVIMEPSIVQVVREQDGSVLERNGADEWRRALSGAGADEMRQLMEASVEYGYASGAMIEGVTVGGKTGTAETGSGEPHAWFVGYAEGQEDTYVVSVILENGGRGGEVALPIGRELLQSALEREVVGE